MSSASSAGYGWDAEAPHSCDYLAPVVLGVLSSLGSRRVLDLGAGNGSLAGSLHAAGFDAVGVEVDARGVEIARSAHPAVPFYRYSVGDDPARLLAAERPFDTVVSTEVIEHLYKPLDLARYAHGVLERGGRFVVTTPYHGYLKNLALSLAGKWDDHHTALWDGGHIKFFSAKTLASLLEQGGFAWERFVGVGRCPGLWKSMLVVAKKA